MPSTRLSFLASACLIGAIRGDEVPGKSASEPERPGLIHDLRVGLHASVGHALVRPEFLVEAVQAVAGGFFFALYTIYAINTLHLNPGTLGLIISVGGIGALAGAILSSRLAAWAGLGRAMIVCLAASRVAAR